MFHKIIYVCMYYSDYFKIPPKKSVFCIFRCDFMFMLLMTEIIVILTLSIAYNLETLESFLIFIWVSPSSTVITNLIRRIFL